ncbi:MAG: hypothetical protein ACXVXP_05845 [Mycobacteriaceae bacterium]
MTHTGRHRDDSNKARIDCERRDLNDSLTWARDHHHPRHSAFVAKVRSA